MGGPDVVTAPRARPHNRKETDVGQHNSAQERFSGQDQEPVDYGDSDGDGDEHPPTETPEPDESDKEVAREMRKAYQDRPTVVLPGSGGTVSGTAINDWLDEDGESKYASDEDAPAAQTNAVDEATDDVIDEEQIAKDKAFNEQARKDRANWDETAADEAAASK